MTGKIVDPFKGRASNSVVDLVGGRLVRVDPVDPGPGEGATEGKLVLAKFVKVECMAQRFLPVLLLAPVPLPRRNPITDVPTVGGAGSRVEVAHDEGKRDLVAPQGGADLRAYVVSLF